MTEVIFDGQRVYEHIRKLSVEIGNRRICSDGNRGAREYLCETFEKLGLQVREQPFEVEYTSLIEAKLEVLDPPLGEIPAAPILAPANTPPEGIEGEVVFVEGTQEPQVGPHLKGKIVLWSAAPKFSARPFHLVQHEPLAIVGIWPDLGVSPRHDQLTGGRARAAGGLPMFWITWETGFRLLKAGVKRMRVRLRTEQHTGQVINVIGELPGREHPEQIVLVGGHYDSPPGVPGATDNASGVAMALELARVYAGRGSRRTLRFIGWDGEEGGWNGSAGYARTLWQEDKQERQATGFDPSRDKTELERHLLCVNMDVIGMLLGFNACYVIGPDHLLATIDGLSKELGVPHQVKYGLYGSDHEPLAWVGTPALTFGREGPPFNYIHMENDTIDLIDPQQLQQLGELIDTFIRRNVAEAMIWPFERRIPENQAKDLEQRLASMYWKLED